MSIRELREAVEAGDDAAVMAALKMIGRTARDKGDFFQSYDMEKAYNGSLDAAKRLHDALLPGWKVAGIHEEDGGRWWAEIRRGYITSYDKAIVAPHQFNSPTPARAWLIAILRALEEEGRDG